MSDYSIYKYIRHIYMVSKSAMPVNTDHTRPHQKTLSYCGGLGVAAGPAVSLQTVTWHPRRVRRWWAHPGMQQVPVSYAQGLRAALRWE